jgi:hypothetical protein
MGLVGNYSGNYTCAIVRGNYGGAGGGDGVLVISVEVQRVLGKVQRHGMDLDATQD